MSFHLQFFARALRLFLLYNDVTYSTPLDIANCLCEHFSTASSRLISENLGYNLSLPCTSSRTFSIHTFAMKPIEICEVEFSIKSLKKRNTYGGDGITSDLLQKIYHCFINILVHLFNKSIAEGYFPIEMRIAYITALFKKGSSLDPDNYRQISILSLLSIIFEKLIYNRLIEFFFETRTLDCCSTWFLSKEIN